MAYLSGGVIAYLIFILILSVISKKIKEPNLDSTRHKVGTFLLSVCYHSVLIILGLFVFGLLIALIGFSCQIRVMIDKANYLLFIFAFTFIPIILSVPIIMLTGMKIEKYWERKKNYYR